MTIWAIALLSVLATWAILLVLFTGIGLVVHRAAGLRVIDADALLLAAWMGIGGTIATLQLWHLFLPVGAPAALLLAAVGCLGVVLACRDMDAWLRRVEWRRRLLLLVVLLGVATFAANRAMGPLTNYDSGAYHIPVIEWTRAYAIVPGLANLHGRLAFNNSSLLLAALLEDGPWAGRANHLLNGFLIALLLVQAVVHTTRLPHATGAYRQRCAFDLALLAPLLALLMANSLLTGFSPDMPAGVTLLAALSLLVGHTRREPDTDPARVRYELIAAAALLAVATSMKVSVGFTAVLAWIVAFALLWRRSAAGEVRRVVTIAVLASTAVIGPWLVRGAILSGYPLYPSTVLAVPVDWRVPEEQARAELAWIGHFARAEEGDVDAPYAAQRLLGWAWFDAWSSQMRTDWRQRALVAQPLVVTLLILWSLVLLRMRTASRKNAAPDSTGASGTPPALWWLVACAAAGSLFWFVTAPRFEFGYSALAALAALSVALLFAHIPAGTRAAAGVTIAALALGVSPVVERVVHVVRTYNDPLPDRIIDALLVRRGRDQGFHPPNPAEEPVTTYRTASGLLLYVPTETTRCFRAPLPCTPHPAPNLRLRGSDLRDGFRVDGPWMAERWPGWPDHRSLFLESWRAYVNGTKSRASDAGGEDPM